MAIVTGPACFLIIEKERWKSMQTELQNVTVLYYNLYILSSVLKFPMYAVNLANTAMIAKYNI